jgi:tripartite ATP-independent transporter DctP family solute receptor
MRKRYVATLLSVLLTSAFNGAVFAAGTPVVLRLAEIHEADYPTTVGAFEIARLVEQRTNGHVKIEVFYGMKLGDEAAVIQKILAGEIDLTRVNIGPLAHYVPGLNAFLMPYIFRDTDHMLKVVNGAVGNDVIASFDQHGFIGFGWFDGGTRNFYTKKAVRKPADLKGMRIRSMQSTLMLSVISAFGAEAIAMPHGKVIDALKDNSLDGAENNYPTYDETDHYQLAKYFVEDEHTHNPDIIMGSKKSLEEKLSKTEIEIIRQAVRDVQPLQFALWAKKNKESKDKVIAAGCVITVLTPEEKQAFVAAVQPVYEAQPQEMQSLIKRIKAVE